MKNSIVLEIGKPFAPHGLFNFLQVPICVAQYRGISPGAKLVYGRLFLYTLKGKSTVAWPKLTTLADECGMSVKQVARYVNELVADGFFTKRRAGGGKNNEYHFIGHPAYAGEIGEARNGGDWRTKGDRPYTANQAVIGRIRPVSDRSYTTCDPSFPPYYSEKKNTEEMSTSASPSQNTTPNTSDHRDALRASQPQEEELSSLRGNVFCSSTTTPNTNSVEESTDLTAPKNLVEDEPQGAINISNASMSNSYSESGTADVDDFSAIVRMVKSKQVKTPTSAKQRQAIADAFDTAIAKDPMGVDELESRYRAFVHWCDTKTGKIPVERFFSRRLTSWDARETPAVSRQLAAAKPMAEKRPEARGASENRSTANLRAIWNECCPSAPTDESIESVEGWRRWAKDAEFVRRFREIATAAEVARAGGMGWLTIGWIVGKKDGNALWNWQRLLNGDFAPRNKKADSVTTAPQIQDDAIQQMRDRGIQREKELMVKLRQEWEQKNREREEDALPPKPKPSKLAELEAKYETN